MDKICEKYHINEENKEYTKKLMTILKDADALDRVRLDFNKGITITDLNPKSLRTDTAKRLLNVSYQLEELTNKVSFDKILAYKAETQKEENKMQAYKKSLKFIPTEKDKLNLLEKNNQKTYIKNEVDKEYDR